MKVLELFLDADFTGDWTSDDPLNPENALSRTEFVSIHAGMPAFWHSKLQTEITISTFEAECI